MLQQFFSYIKNFFNRRNSINENNEENIYINTDNNYLVQEEEIEYDNDISFQNMEISSCLKKVYFNRILNDTTIVFEYDSNHKNECIICLKEFKKGDMIRMLQCTHKYHRNCIDKWLFIKLSCPECRIF